MTRKSRRKRTICVLTGTRAEYGLLKSLLDAINARNDLTLDLVATGMHLLDQAGRTIDDIARDGWDVSLRIPIYSGRDRREDLGPALAKLVAELGTWLVGRRVDFLVLLGDRIEVLGGACAALMAGVPIAHLHGGELAPGELDDRIRFAVSSMANLHFVSTSRARARLIRMGHRRDTIHVVGAIGLDHIYATKRRLTGVSRKAIRADLACHGDKEMIVVVYHPCGFGAAGEYQRMQRILQAVEGYEGIIIGPNTDPGYSGVLRAIKVFVRSNPDRWRFVVNLDRTRYLQAIWAAGAIVGNSSSGIIEANALGTSAVNILPRQQGRDHNGNTVIDSTYDKLAIRRAITTALSRSREGKVRPSRRFGRGDCGATVAEVLATVPINRQLKVKAYYC